MLERLLQAGFDKENSLKLINSTVSANTDEDIQERVFYGME